MDHAKASHNNMATSTMCRKSSQHGNMDDIVGSHMNMRT